MRPPNTIPGTWPPWTQRATEDLRKSTGNQQEQLAQTSHRSKQSSSAENSPYSHLDRQQSQPGLSQPYPCGDDVIWVNGMEYAEVQAENQRLWKMLKELEDTNRLQKTGFQDILEQQCNNLREKETELGELKRTLRMYDESSEAEMQTKVDEINAKIQATEGTAMRWTKASSSSPVVAADGGEVGDAEDDNIKRVIGGLLFHALRDSKVATPCLMVAWQACIVSTVEKILCSFSATLAISEEGRLSDAVLKRISDEVMTGEVQPAYGRWRLITHQYLRQTLSGAEEAAIGAYVSEALASCLAVGRLAMQNRFPSDQSLVDDFQAELRIIITEAIELSYMIREKMITANYEPYVPAGGAPFDPKFMAVEQQEKAAPDDRVICTTGIGLLYWRKEGGEGTSKTSPKLAFKKAQVFTVGNFHVLNSATRANKKNGRK